MKAGAFTPATLFQVFVADLVGDIRSMKAGAFTPATPPMIDDITDDPTIAQ